MRTRFKDFNDSWDCLEFGPGQATNYPEFNVDRIFSVRINPIVLKLRFKAMKNPSNRLTGV